VKPHIHSSVSVKLFGGKPEDYQKIHDFMDISKSSHADVRHRSILHHALGAYIAEMVFGITIVNSDGKTVSVRDVAEQHIIDDLGKIPSVTDWMNEMSVQSWMGQPSITKKTFTLQELQDGLTQSRQNNCPILD